MTTTIYRVENSAGEGPYTDDLAYALVMRGSCRTGEHECGQVPDQQEYERQGWHYGFRCMADCKQWFQNYVRGLTMLGFGIAEYEVPENSVIDGKREVMFDYGHAQFKGSKPLSTLKEM